MSKLAALYARVSTREQKDHGTSLDWQIEAMRSWAGDNGYEVGYEFAEDWTGTELDRPKLNEVKRLAEVEEIDAVLVYSWDRLARDMGHQHVLRYLFEEKWRVKLICVTQPEMDELASKIYQSAIAMAAEIENRLRRERVTRGVRQAAITRGQLPGGGAGLYGYDYSPKSKGGNGKRTINEEEARVVRLIYSLLTEKGMSLYEIAKRLEQMAIRTKKGLKKWRRCTIYRMVTNPTYCGKTYAFRWEGVEPEKPMKSNRRRKRSSIRLRPQEDWVELEQNATPAIVSEKTWEAAQKQLKARKKATRRKPKYAYLLRGMVKCYCGKSMVANTVSGRWRYYRCCATSGVELAHHFHVPAKALEERIWSEVEAILTHPEIVVHQLEKEKETGETLLQERMTEVDKTIAELELAERRVISLYSLGKLDARKIEEEIDRIKTERQAWEQELGELNERLQAKLELTAQAQRLEDICQAIGSELSAPSFERKREILEAFGLRVRLRKDGSYECFGAIPAICEALPSPRGLIFIT